MLHGILDQHHQVMQRNGGKHVPDIHKGITEPPNMVHTNSHVAAPIPGSRKQQQPKPRPVPGLGKNSDVQTEQSRYQQRFIPGTASAAAPAVISVSQSAVSSVARQRR